MAVGKSNAKITDKGGNILINVLLTAGALPTTPTSGTNTFDLGHLSQSSVDQNASKTSSKSEDGEVQVTSFEYEGITTGTLMQGDKDLIDYLGNTVKGAQVLQIKYTGVVNGADQWIFEVGQVTPQFKITRPNGANSMPYEFTRQNLTSDFTLSTAALSAIAATLGLSTSSFFPAATTYTISSSKNYLIVEV